MNNRFMIRKLTPLEYVRLMGLTDSDYDKMISVGMSYSSIYKQCGNGIVANCVQLIFEHLYKAMHSRGGGIYVLMKQIHTYILKQMKNKNYQRIFYLQE